MTEAETTILIIFLIFGIPFIITAKTYLFGNKRIQKNEIFQYPLYRNNIPLFEEAREALRLEEYFRSEIKNYLIKIPLCDWDKIEINSATENGELIFIVRKRG